LKYESPWPIQELFFADDIRIRDILAVEEPGTFEIVSVTKNG